MTMKEWIIYIPYWGKKYPLIIQDTWKIDQDNWEIVHISCEIINLNQDYLKEDLPSLLMDIEWMIREELSQKATKELKHSESWTKNFSTDTEEHFSFDFWEEGIDADVILEYFKNKESKKE